MSLSIEIDGLQLQSDATQRKFWLIDYTGMIDAKLNCSGIMVRPKLILKLLCKLTDRQAHQARYNQARDAAVNGTLRLW